MSADTHRLSPEWPTSGAGAAIARVGLKKGQTMALTMLGLGALGFIKLRKRRP